MQKTTLDVIGMHCASCQKLVGRALQKVPGVINAEVNLMTNKAYVEHEGTLDFDTAKKEVSGVGYDIAQPHQLAHAQNTNSQTTPDEDPAIQELNKAKLRMLTAWVFALPIAVWMIWEMIFGVWPTMEIYNLSILLLAIVPHFGPGASTLITGFKALTKRTANMDTLIALGTTVAFITGPLSLVVPDIANYSGVGAMIMAFHLTGRYIEAQAKGKASQAIKRLLELGAKTARILINGDEREIDISQLAVNDVMVIRPGEKIPTDGTIIEGTTSIDQSMATGESLPVTKHKGDSVLGSTINQEGLIKVKVAKIGGDTFLSQVIKLVEEAQGTRIPIQEFADRITGVFVPIIVMIAIATVTLWLAFPDNLSVITMALKPFLPWMMNSQSSSVVSQALFAGIAVLVIACPCALGLATPTTLMVASGLGAQNGILIRKGAALQTMKDVTAIVLDKTGTITQGKPTVTDLISVKRKSESDTELLTIAASAEQGSEHPLARAIVAKAKNENLALSTVTGFKAIAGGGLSATVKKQKVIIGTHILLKRSMVNVKNLNLSHIEMLESQGKTVIHVAIKNTYIGSIAIADTVKPDSASAIGQLTQQGYSVFMITGDNERTAKAIAQQIGIPAPNVFAHVLPDQKAAKIKELQLQHKVAFVGDGINDAPALTQADVGIAMGTGTDIAIESGDLILVRGQLSVLVSAINLSKAAFAKIKQNLFWAFAYNVLAIPLAMIGLLHPVIAEAAMASSSITVVTNANLLKKVKI